MWNLFIGHVFKIRIFYLFLDISIDSLFFLC